MNELSLFTGAGGGVLGTHGLLGWKCRGYVEWEPYCQRVIRQRIQDGILDEAPIFGDVRAFVSEGYARKYRGMVDVVSGGFPCQPFSVAGKRQAGDDERDMWPATLDVIREVRPRFVFLENVAGLLAGSHGYFGRVLGGLAEAGYNARWCVLGADDVGAPHRRKRLWIMAYRNDGYGVDAEEEVQSGRDAADDGGGELGNSAGTGLEGAERAVAQGARKRLAQYDQAWWDIDPADLAHSKHSIWKQYWRVEGMGGEREQVEENGGGQRFTEPFLGRVAHGVAHRVDRLKAIGNGQVPLVAAAAWQILREGIEV